ncbi:hypothetical protein ACSBR2_042071 [Camellia fascicularis]
MNVNGFFYLKKWNSEHICSVAMRTASNPRMGSELVVDVIAERVRDKPLTRPTDVKYHFQKDYGFTTFTDYQVGWHDHNTDNESNGGLSRASDTWAGKICPKMESKLDETYKKGRSWTNSQLNNDVCEVHSHPSVLVDIGKHTCSCFQWQINGLPSEHAMVAIRNSGIDLNVLVDPYFHVVNHRVLYSHTIYPIPTVEKLEINPDKYVILPPAVRRPPGRPKKKRIPSQEEDVQQIRCERCGRMGNHNRTTCKKPI